jgi:hypothetical protein
LREARESNYWLLVLKDLDSFDSDDFNILLKESSELKNILAPIFNNTKCKLLI